MSTSSHDSGIQTPLATPGPGDDTAVPTAWETELAVEGATARGGPTVWLDGEVVACRCPECHALVSIRGWLMMGDCLRCGTSVELTEEQEQEVVRLLAAQQQAPARPAPSESPARPAARPAAAPAREKSPQPQKRPPTQPQEKPKLQPRPAARPSAEPRPAAAHGPPPLPTPAVAAVAPPRAPVVIVVRQRSWFAELLGDLPAWLISVIFHIVLILLLGLWVIDVRKPEPFIALSATLGTRHREGDPGVKDPLHDEIEIEDPGKLPPPTAQARAAAQQDAAELALPRDAQAPNLPPLKHLLRGLAKPSRKKMFEGRDPRVRAAVVDAQGGTTFSEAAVARGLRWLAAHQSVDGSWSLNNFQNAGECHGQCSGQGQESDTGATALALLPFLGAGQTHLQGRYKDTVARGLRWLMQREAPNGDLSGSGVGRMYAHGQSTIVLSEAFALTGDEQLREPTQRAVRFIVDAQHFEGGWRYTPGEPGDLSVVGWQVMALHSARMAMLDVPDETLERASDFLDRVRKDDLGATYAYQAPAAASPAMSAEGLLCRQYLGWGPEEPGLVKGAELLSTTQLPNKDAPNIYYWYYATQVMHHLGGVPWNRWNMKMRDTLVAMQESQGHQAGSWTPRGGAIGDHDTAAGGRIYMTSLAVCTLEVYYRHLPLYRPLELDRP